MGENKKEDSANNFTSKDIIPESLDVPKRMQTGDSNSSSKLQDIPPIPKLNIFPILIFGFIACIIVAGLILFGYQYVQTKDNIGDTSNSPENQGILANTNPDSPPCIEDWNCSEWEGCIETRKIRKCIDLKNCGTEYNKPKTWEDCCMWQCEDWSECYPANFQARKCNIDDGCLEKNKPTTMQNCTYKSLCTDTEGGTKNISFKGVIKDKFSVNWEDNCLDNEKLSEVYCSKLGTWSSIEYKCKVSCSDGICLNETKNLDD